MYFIYLFVFGWVFSAARRLSLVVASGESRGCSLVAVCGLLNAVASFAAEHRP